MRPIDTPPRDPLQQDERSNCMPERKSEEKILPLSRWPRRGNARHRPKQFTKRLPPAGLPKAHAEVLCCRRRRRNNGWAMRQRWRARLEATANDPNSSKAHCREGYLATVQIKRDIYSSPLNICRVVLHLLRKRCGAAGLGELQWAPASRRGLRGPTEEHRALSDTSSYKQQRVPAGTRKLLRAARPSGVIQIFGRRKKTWRRESRTSEAM
jgi:hypothetical protein